MKYLFNPPVQKNTLHHILHPGSSTHVSTNNTHSELNYKNFLPL